ncbi:MAG: DUF2461 domain-containing protein, partial [Deltaproteobacteria bacterium]|nr:DUF2461 domain-containing protein [Deltaproteobacteria bacterium]
YFHLTAESFLWSAGCYRFPAPALERWAEFTQDPQKGNRLLRIKAAYEKKGLSFSEPDRKRLPAGADPKSPRALFLLHRGFYTWSDPAAGLPKEILSPQAAPYLAGLFAGGRSLFEWLADLFQGLPGPGPDPGKIKDAAPWD